MKTVIEYNIWRTQIILYNLDYDNVLQIVHKSFALCVHTKSIDKTDACISLLSIHTKMP